MFNRVLKVPTKGLWDALRDLVPFVQFEKTWKHPWRSVSTVAGYNLKKHEKHHGGVFFGKAAGCNLKKHENLHRRVLLL